MLSVLLAACGADEPPAGLSGLLENLDHEIALAARSDQFSGVVLLALHGKPFFRKGYGLASRRYGIPNRIDTKFNLGSANKMFTTIAIAQLQEQGKLNYDDAIGRYLGSDWISEEIGRKVRIRHTVVALSNLSTGLDAVRDKISAVLVDNYRRQSPVKS